MKILILGDSHFGIKNDNPVFLKHQEFFYKTVLIPYLISNNINTVVQVGDFFDRRKYVNFNTLHQVNEFLLKQLEKHNIKLYVILGNHCVYYKNILDVNSPNLLLKNNGNVTVIDSPQTITFDGLNIDFYPWICEQNMDQTLELIEKKKSEIAIGHFELSGFQMDKGHICVDGMDKKTLKNYDMVMSGHFHHRSNDGHIYYVGTPYEMTWACYNDPKGFHVFDTKTRELDFHKNPNILFHKFYYDDSDQELKSDIKNKIKSGFFKQYRNCYVKLAVLKKTNLKLFDSLLHELYHNISVADLIIVEDFSNPLEKLEHIKLDQMDDTLSSLKKHVDELTLPDEIVKDTLKNILHKIYMDASLNKHNDIT